MGIPAEKSCSLPPMLRQYVEYKEQYPDCLLFFQVGDFYELFFEDAVIVSQKLNLTLTSRDKNSDKPVPMCGVPIAVVDGYLDRLVDAGFSVAIVSQKSAAKPGKGMVERGLDRIVTPGIRVLGNSEDADASCIAAVYPAAGSDEVAIAFGDPQSGVLNVRDGVTLELLHRELLRILPREVVLPLEVEGRQINRRLSWVRRLEHSLKGCSLKFRGPHFIVAPVSSEREFAAIDGYSALSGPGRRAARLLINVIDETTVDSVLNVTEIAQHTYDDVVTIDATTRANLELVKTLKEDSVEGSLFGYIDRTVTVGGRRTLRSWLLNPLLNVEAISHRYDGVEQLAYSIGLAKELAAKLKYCVDCDRIAARIDLGIVSPKELGALRDCIVRLSDIRSILSEVFERSVGGPATLLQTHYDRLYFPTQFTERIEHSLVDLPPLILHEGGVFKDGYDAELDRLRNIRSKGRSWIAAMEASEREATGIPSLKIKFNNVLGYFIEVTKAHLEKVPGHYNQRQSMTNAARFVTEQLKAQEEEILGARTRQIELEKRLYDELKEVLKPAVDDLRQLHVALSSLDVLVALAVLADQENYVRPEVDAGTDLFIEKGRHPVLAGVLQEGFIPNSTELRGDGKTCVVLTGPNMGGKSTYLRQTALIVILAQMGSFVPAQSARIGIVDRVFARLGASDDQAEGESTFMVEMREAAHIVLNATERSLLLIDEIGRGTATADGLAIAQAILEWIVKEVRSRTLFATHFHELTSLDRSCPTLTNLSVGSVDRGGEVIFTHAICPGPANRSYGIEVARLAALPEQLLKRAKDLLVEHETGGEAQLSMFSTLTPSPANRPEPEPIRCNHTDYDELLQLRSRLDALDVNSMTPLEALQALFELQQADT